MGLSASALRQYGTHVVAAAAYVKDRDERHLCCFCPEPVDPGWTAHAFSAGVVGVPTNVRLCPACREEILREDGCYTVAECAARLVQRIEAEPQFARMVGRQGLEDEEKRRRAAEASRRSKAAKRDRERQLVAVGDEGSDRIFEGVE